MIPVALAHSAPNYEGLAPPFGPHEIYPELEKLYDGRLAPAAEHNSVFAAVRSALHGLGLDAEAFGSDRWNPLGDLVRPGGGVVLKPNFIRHYNPSPCGEAESVITHGSILRAVADYAFLAVGSEGSVTLAEAPQHDCAFAEISKLTGLDTLQHHFRDSLGVEFKIVDIRREEVVLEDSIVVSRESLSGDPSGYRVVDLGERSFFADSELDPRRFRGADYDPNPTAEHHMTGRNEYLLSETVLSADLVVNLPKLKTHKKTGVTLALKNLVGINGDKNWLPHHCVGSVAEGGDEFPGSSPVDRWRSRASEIGRSLLKRGLGVGLIRFAKRFEDSVRGTDVIRSGNWHGNQTTWRMCLDLNRCLYYSDRKGLHLDSSKPVRTVLTIIDAVVAGENAGPLAPDDVPMGIVLAATDPVALDLAAIRLMGFDEKKIPKIREAMADIGPRITAVQSPDDVIVMDVDPMSNEVARVRLDELSCSRTFTPHLGWRDHIERHH